MIMDNSLFFTTVFLIAKFFTVFVLIRFMSVFFTAKKSAGLTTIVYANFFILTSTVHLLFSIPILNLLCHILCLFFITLAYKTTLKKRVIAVCFTYLCFMAVDITVFILMNYPRVSITEQTHPCIIGIVAIALGNFFISLLAQNFKNTRTNNQVSKIYWLASLLIPLSSIYLLAIIYSSGVSQANTIILVCIVFAINVLTFHLHDALSLAYNHKLEAAIFKQEKEHYYNQCEIMQASGDDLRGFRHDIKNHLITLNHFLGSNQSAESKKYLEDLIGKIDMDSVFSSTGNIAFDSIINYKLRGAKANGIEVHAEINIPEKLEVDAADIVIIVGNLLDNAILAVTRVEDKKLALKINYSKGRVFIYVENTFDGNVKYDENGAIITIQDKETHGYGLKNVRSAVDKYSGVLKLSSSESVFKADVMLYLAG